MSRPLLLTLRIVVGLCLLGSVVVQLGLLPMVWLELSNGPAWFRIPLVAIVFLSIVCLQVVGVSVGKLLTLIRQDRVFSSAPFRYVDAMIGAIGSLSVLILGAAVVARFANHAEPGDEIAPGLVALICGASLVVAGVALLAVVQRGLLAQAVALAARARAMQDELDQVT